jgi:hypothetical protein
MIATYHDVLLSNLTEYSGERWTGFGRMRSLDTVLDSTSPAAEDGIPLKPVQRSPVHSARFDGRTSW